MEKNLGHATAYGYAKSKGYTGTEEEFGVLMASYASVAQDASQSASSASTSAQTASQAAQTATSKASEATTAATTATTKASEASTSAGTASTAAQTATNKASEATTAATTATTKASEANQSATSASTAKINAETARDAAAQSASEAANSAIEAAQSAQSVDAERLNRVAFGSYVTESASGAIANFPDGADDIPMKDVLVHIEPVQEGSGDPSPDNVRPITGWTGAKVTRTGKNLLDADEIVGGVLDANGVLSTQNVTINSKGDGKVDWTSSITWRGVTSGYIEVRGGHAYKLSLAETPSYVIYAWYAKDKSFMSRNTHGGDAFVSVTAPDGAMYLRITIQQSVAGTFSYNNLQLELGSTATDYEPYSGQTYDITFPTEAGTVYGGTLDVTTGELVVNRAMVDLGTLTWAKHASLTNVFQSYRPNSMPAWKIVPNGSVADAICDIYKLVSSAVGGVDAVDMSIALGTGTSTIVYTHDSRFNDVADYKSAMSGVQLCYELATPITYHLTPQEITSLLGTNNLWADTGNSEVTYRVDPALLLDDELSEVQSMIAGVESSAVATKNYSIGDLVIVGSILYEVTAAIASGETISASNTVTTTVDNVIKNRMTTVDNAIRNRIADSIDDTLTVSGKAADAKAVGDEIDSLKSDLNAKDGLINKGAYSSTEFVQGKRTIANYDTITADSKRCATKMCFHLYKGDQLTVSGIGNDQKAAIVSSYGYDSGWKTSDYTYTATSEGYLFINVATSDGNTNITPSDISITVTVNDMSSITYKNTAILNELNIGQIRNTVRKNLIGKNVGTKYPAKIKKGEKFTVSSADGQVFSTSFRIKYFNANKELIDYNTIPANVNAHTITLNYNDVSFISVHKSPQTTIQVEIGDTKTAYEPYFDDIHECDSVLWAKELSRKGYFTIDKNEMVDGTRDSEGYRDYINRCHSKDIFIPAHKGDRVIASATNQQVMVAVTSDPMLTDAIFTTGWQDSIDIVNEYEGYYILLGYSAADSFTGTFKIIPNVYTNNYEDEVFASEIEATINSVRECQTEPSITFVLCTDIHYGTTEKGNPYLFDRSAVNMKAVIDSVRTDFIVCLGDITEGDSVNTEAYSIKVNNTLRNLGIPYLLAIGNHDDNRYMSGSTFTADDMYKYYDSFVHNKVVFNEDTNGRDYYIDCDIYKTRFIIIDSNTVGAYGFASETVTWFQNNALNTPNDYLVVVLVHESSVPAQNYNNSSLANGTAITDAITYYLESGKPIIQFYGHSHCDVAFTSPFLSIGTNCLKFENTNGDPSKWPSGATKPTRVVGEISEDCWDVVVLRPLSRRVDCIRFGAGNNRSFTY